MPVISEIARAAGCSKPHVTKVLKELGLWEDHTRMEGKTRVVDDYAASAATDSITRRMRELGRAEVAEVPAREDSIAALTRIYEGRIEDLKQEIARLEDQVRRLEGDKDDLQSRLDAASRKAEEAERRASETAMSLNEVMARGLIARIRNAQPRGLITDKSAS